MQGGLQSISFQFGDINLKRECLVIINKKILYNYIYPEPDYFGNGYIEYRGEDSISKVSKTKVSSSKLQILTHKTEIQRKV